MDILKTISTWYLQFEFDIYQIVYDEIMQGASDLKKHHFYGIILLSLECGRLWSAAVTVSGAVKMQ